MMDTMNRTYTYKNTYELESKSTGTKHVIKKRYKIFHIQEKGFQHDARLISFNEKENSFDDEMDAMQYMVDSDYSHPYVILPVFERTATFL